MASEIRSVVRNVVFELVIIIGIVVSFYVFIGDREFVFQGINSRVSWYIFPLFLSLPLIVFLIIDMYRVSAHYLPFKLRKNKIDMDEDVVVQNVDENVSVTEDKSSMVSSDSVSDNKKDIMSQSSNLSQTVDQSVDKQVQNTEQNMEGSQDNKNVSSSVGSEVVKGDETIKNIESQIDLLQKELKMFKEHTDQSIQEIKDAIINLRSTISEIDNPFNFMKKYAEVFGIDALEKLEQSKVVSYSQVSESSPESVQIAGGKKVVVTVNGRDEKIDNLSKNARDVEKMHDSFSVSDKGDIRGGLFVLSIEPEKIIHMIVWVNKVSSLFGKDYTLTLLDFYHSAGLLDDKIYNAMGKALELIDKGKKAGVSISTKDYIITMIELMKILGLDKQYSSFVSIIELLLKDGLLGGFE
jgi:hypothetical protein